MRRIVVNGRFLAQPRTGVQRYALETLRALDRLLAAEPRYLEATRWQLALPRQVSDPPRLDQFEMHTLQFLDGHAWEQGPLALFARGAYLINPSYSGPIFKRHQLITVHDAAVQAQPDTYSRPYRLFNRALMALLAPRVDTLMTVSRFSAREIAERYGVRRDDIVVGRGGWEHVAAPAGSTPAQDSALLQRHGLQPRGYLLAVGSPKASKNFALIAQALSQLGPRWRMPVAVAGARDASVYRDTGAAHPALHWLGYVPDEELAVLYRHATWFVFPSLYEGFGLPALEALALGCPVLAARGSAIPEVFGDAVLYFDPHDAGSLAALLESVVGRDDLVALRERLAAQAAVRLATYRWSANARILLARLVAVGAVELRTPPQPSPLPAGAEALADEPSEVLT